MKNHDLTIRHKMLSFGNTLCAAQQWTRPKSSYLFYEKLYTYVSPRVSGIFLARIFPSGLSLYTLVINEFTHADLVYADFLRTKKKCVSQGMGVHENVLLVG